MRSGDPERPLFVPWDDTVHARFNVVEQDWARFRARWIGANPNALQDLRAQTVTFASHIDSFVTAIESHMARWTSLLHLLQMSLLAMAILGAALLIYTGYLFVLEPVGQLKLAIERIQAGDFDARVESGTSDEFGTLADGFNGMAQHLQSMYRHLEHKVAEKTAQLEEKHERLESLYEVTALAAKATSLDELAQGFAKNIARITHADGVAVRWSDQDKQHYLMLAAHGLLPQQLQGDAGAFEFLVNEREVGEQLAAVARQGWPEQTGLELFVCRGLGNAQSTPATRASETYLPATLLDILSVRSTSS